MLPGSLRRRRPSTSPTTSRPSIRRARRDKRAAVAARLFNDGTNRGSIRNAILQLRAAHFSANRRLLVAPPFGETIRCALDAVPRAPPAQSSSTVSAMSMPARSAARAGSTACRRNSSGRASRRCPRRWTTGRVMLVPGSAEPWNCMCSIAPGRAGRRLPGRTRPDDQPDSISRAGFGFAGCSGGRWAAPDEDFGRPAYRPRARSLRPMQLLRAVAVAVCADSWLAVTSRQATRPASPPEQRWDVGMWSQL